MSTRSTISIKKENGLYDMVYCHFDGYPDGVGSKLEKYYNTPELVNELISNGDMSSLGTSINNCEFYKDVGEDFHNEVDLTYEQLCKISINVWAEYMYIFNTDENCWKCHDRHYNNWVSV